MKLFEGQSEAVNRRTDNTMLKRKPVVKIDTTQAEEGQTTQSPKERQTTQWPKVEGLTQWPKEEGQITQ